MSHNPQEKPAQPALSELLSSYLRGRGEMSPAIQNLGEVIPFDSAPVQPVDARVAWDEATLAARHYHSQCTPQRWEVVPEWSALVAAHEPVAALPFCLGNFPQLVRDLHGLLHAQNLSAMRPAPTRPANSGPSDSLAHDALKQNQYGRFLMTIGSLRLAKHFDAAERLLDAHERDLPSGWQAAVANERAAINWHRGQAEEARALWAAQEPNVPVLFNRGMSALFSEDVTKAKESLVGAVEQLPDDNAWHHLGRLYLALAGIRS